MKKFVLLLCAALLASAVTGCGRDEERVYFFNWMHYVDPAVLDMFYDEYGIRVIMGNFESNHQMHATIRDGGGYDVIVPSEYMLERMIREGLLQPLDFDMIPNFRHIDPIFTNIPADPRNLYSVAYMWGTLGIIYDASRVYEPVTSWGALWDDRYAGQILMYDSVRDTFSVALSKLGYDINTTNTDELESAVEILIDQLHTRNLVRAYMAEPIKHAFISGEGVLAVMWSGDALYVMSYNENFNYVVPYEGSNIWVDVLAVPANARNPENAMKFINFLSRPDIAAMNSEYIWYTTANLTAMTEGLIDPYLRYHPVFYPSPEVIARTTFHADLGEYFTALYVRLFERVMIGR
jgi:spermidine/putrescine transport system substrate-binding protein